MLADTGQPFRLIIQFIAAEADEPAHYRLVGYRDKTALQPVDFYSVSELLCGFLEAAIPVAYQPRLPAHFPSRAGIVYSEELMLDLRAAVRRRCSGLK